VILDVVYNHTGEGNERGPTLSLRGIDNTSYYRLNPDNGRYYVDFTGTGNTLNMMQPRSLQLVTDSLRYWVQEMHIDGFRFDLASALARELYEVDRLGSFFDIIAQDPVISQVKLIAEPWDLGDGGYQVGNFPVHWAEWNGKYRDTVRRFWRGDMGPMAEMATRLAGSADLYEQNGRRPHASINFVTAHDGFTMRDLVSYNEKHNDANGEGNRDGSNDNISWNHGVEGETEDAHINTLRRQQMRNFLATLLTSQGVPMILGGDEIGRTQRGNNNAYCQDNELSWFDWNLEPWQQDLLRFTRALIRLRTEQPALRRRRFLQGRRIQGSDVHDIAWFLPEGEQITEGQWQEGWRRCFGLRLAGDAIEEVDERGHQITGDTLMILFNAGDQDVPFTLPATRRGRHWRRYIDTSMGRPANEQASQPSVYHLHARSMAVLRLAARSAR
jgi:glycogen operon protein